MKNLRIDKLRFFPTVKFFISKTLCRLRARGLFNFEDTKYSRVILVDSTWELG